MTDSMLGKVFALCTDEEQAEFLNVAGQTLRRAAGVDGAEMQCCRIVDHLDGNGRELVEKLAEFIRLDRETPRIEKRVVYQDVIEPRPAPEEPPPPPELAPF